jgi:serine/threonine protein kinase
MEKNVINIKDELLEKGNDIELSLAKEEDKNILSTIFFKKYKPIEQISKGNYSLIYSGINIETNESVAIKLESRNIKEENQLLPNEIFYLYKLRHSPGIVRIITTGRTKKYNILIEPLLGSTLYSLYLDHNKNFTLKDICLISIQCITRLESVHNKGIIHCDIKPENFSIGLKDKRIIYLIDFGLSKKYRSDRTKRHIQFNITKTMCGTARYASMNALSGLQLSRRDDLESLSYMILYFLLKKLPWQGITAKNLEKRYKKIYDKKAELEKWDKFKELPTQIQNFVKYCRSLGFSQDPDYKLMKSYFYDLMNINNFFDDKNFSWILDKSIIGSKMPEFFPRKKYFSLYKFYDKIEKKKLSLSVGNHIKYDFNQDKIINENKKRNNSPINLKIDNKINNNEENNQDENVSLSDKSNSSVNGVQNYKLGKFSDNDEES